MLNRAVPATGRDFARATRVANALYSATGVAVPPAPAAAHQGRGDAALMLAGRITRQSLAPAQAGADPAYQTRTIVSPNVENGNATVGDGSPEQQMEPFDPTIAPKQIGDEDEDEAERQADDEEEDDEEMSASADKGVEVIAIEVDTGDEEEIPAEDELAA
jgi:hypothetical protein